MGRPREFNTQEALAQATRVFWTKGYDATTMLDLLAATWLSKSSLYETFGSKRDLFLAALSGYCDHRTRMMQELLQSRPTGRDAIAAFFALTIEQARQEDHPFGCLSCNEAAQMETHDTEVRRVVARDIDAMESVFAEAIRRGQTDGSIAPGLDAIRHARFLNTLHHGLQIMARTRGVDRMEAAAAVALDTLE